MDRTYHPEEDSYIHEQSSLDPDLPRRIMLVKTVFRQVWDEFYKWEQGYCSTTLDGLKCNLRDAPARQHMDRLPPIHDSSDMEIDVEGEVTDDQDCTDSFLVYDFENDLGDVDPVQLRATSFECEAIEPCPAYESCTPAPSNIWRGDDPSEMTFMPLADEPSFKFTKYAKKHDFFAWQSSCDEPDEKRIAVETAYRLYHQHGMSLEDIEGTGVLRQHLCSDNVDWGILWRATQNDILAWPGNTMSSYPPLLNIEVPEESDLSARVSSYLRVFCPVKSCLQAKCYPHETVYPRSLPEFDAEKDIKLPESSEPCGDGCYLHSSSSRLEPLAHNSWDTTSLTDLKTFLSIAPESTSCELAVLCRKPCSEVYAKVQSMQRTVPSHDSESGAPIRHPWRLRSKAKSLRELNAAPNALMLFEDTDPMDFTPVHPCIHPGPCSIQCECVQAKVHCEADCHCDPSCKRRWKGCDCSDSDQPCSRKSDCPCAGAGRECDPKLCKSCTGTEKHSESTSSQGLSQAQGRCMNVNLQVGKSKHLEVRRGKWGFGVFALEDIKKEELICEYTGELIFEPTVMSRDIIGKFLKRAYDYRLNQSYDVDGMNVGNESRFINHSQRPNCFAIHSLVYGDHRIGVFAKRNIAAGTELFLNYGNEFFHDS
ncbi:SET domain-containing protein [Panus rudis PR-1116 ss-1]|nr:SET domain-containing protein [Panus rudis PR-1116 ss-1]